MAADFGGIIPATSRQHFLACPTEFCNEIQSLAQANVIAAGGEKQTRFELWVQKRVAAGAQLVGLYPADAKTLAEFEADDAARTA